MNKELIVKISTTPRDISIESASFHWTSIYVAISATSCYIRGLKIISL